MADDIWIYFGNKPILSNKDMFLHSAEVQFDKIGVPFVKTVYPTDENGNKIPVHPIFKGYKDIGNLYADLAKIMKKHGFIWHSNTPQRISGRGDANHFEYHPNPYSELSKKNPEYILRHVDMKDLEKNAKDQAAKDLNKNSNKLTKEEWLPYFWKLMKLKDKHESNMCNIERSTSKPPCTDFFIYFRTHDMNSVIDCTNQNREWVMNGEW